MSRADRFDRGDFEVRYTEIRPATTEATAPASAASPAPVVPPAEPGPAAPVRASKPVRSRALVWPIAREHLKRVGESVLADRNGHGRPHKGIDLFADAGTEVLAARGGQVLRVVDGRHGSSTAQRRAGLFVDVRGGDARVYRYLHLGETRVAPGASIKQGAVLGTVAAPHTSGLADTPHLHFEVRQGDYDRKQQDYGVPIDPLRLLPPRARGGA
jgi:murein DD-endopeptidase MepM/ murein hydrolase activator NlpD